MLRRIFERLVPDGVEAAAGRSRWPRLFPRRRDSLPVPLAGCNGVLDPAGPVGAAQRLVLIDSLAIMLAIVLPVIVADRRLRLLVPRRPIRAPSIGRSGSSRAISS